MDISNSILSDLTVFLKYARYLPELERRETWVELVDRNKLMHLKKYPHLRDEIEKVYEFVYSRKILPSMRSLQFAGKSIEISPNRIYNCGYLPIDDPAAFGEIMFLLLGGTGVGFSVQEHHIEKLPEIRKPNPDNLKRYLVTDNIEGWADAVKHLIRSYYKGGSSYRFDFSDIRPKGARLITSGGKAPGHEPLKFCLEQITELLNTKNDRDKLSSIEVCDIVCYIADAVLAGGIRRAALIALFSASDAFMIRSKTNFSISEWKLLEEAGPVDTIGEPIKVIAKHYDDLGNLYYDLEVVVDEPYYGVSKKTLYWVADKDIETYLKPLNELPWYYFQPQRGRANNSIALVRSKIKKSKFTEIWDLVKNSNAGEPGFYFTNDKDWGTNPCAEIALRPFQFCNLCEVNVSDIESQDDLNARAKAAAFIGTLQAGYTDFHYLRPIWKKTTEKEALIGVGMTGIATGAVMNLDMKIAAEIVKDENGRVAKLIKIKSAARTTTVKPSGTSSLVVGSSSGVHAWHNDYYIRRIRIGKNESIYTYFQVYHPELLDDDFYRPHDTAVISIPQKAPAGAILRTESALDLLHRVKKIYDNWILPGHESGMNTHNVSTTISVKDTEWDEVGAWMWSNRNSYNGISVLPYKGGTYKQAPFEDCTAEVYNQMFNHLNEIDLTKVIEIDDTTNAKGELACAGGSCEIV